MIHPELETLLQGALDDTLTHVERDRLAKLLAENREARDRAAEFEQLAGLIESLGAADAPPALAQNVLTQISHRPHSVRPLTFQRGVTVNKKILFGLAAAAAIVLAVITYNSNPPATVGTEATIGAAQRAQAPQIAAQDVKLGDTSTQDLLQTETFDAIMKDETLRTILQDENLRAELQKSEVRSALADIRIREALKDEHLISQIKTAAFVRSLDHSEVAARNATGANLKALLSNGAMVHALSQQSFRELIGRQGVATALTGQAFQQALLDKNFGAAMQSQSFAAQLAGR